MQETGTDLTVEGSCSRAPIWVPEDLLCRSYVGDPTAAPQSNQGWHTQGAGTQVVGHQPLLHREDMRERDDIMRTSPTLLLNLCLLLSLAQGAMSILNQAMSKVPHCFGDKEEK